MTMSHYQNYKHNIVVLEIVCFLRDLLLVEVLKTAITFINQTEKGWKPLIVIILTSIGHKHKRESDYQKKKHNNNTAEKKNKYNKKVCKPN